MEVVPGEAGGEGRSYIVVGEEVEEATESEREASQSGQGVAVSCGWEVHDPLNTNGPCEVQHVTQCQPPLHAMSGCHEPGALWPGPTQHAYVPPAQAVPPPATATMVGPA